MSDKIEYSRLLIKRSDDASIIPTIPTGSTLSTFVDTDTFVGEFFLNTTDDRLWVRTDNGQFEIMMSGNTSGNTQNLAQTLIYGNETLGNDIVMSQDDRIYSYTGNTYIEFSKVTDPLIKLFSSGNTGYSDVGVTPNDLSISYSNTGTTIGQIGIDDTSLDLTFSDGVDKDTSIIMDNTYIDLVSLNTDDGYYVTIQLDGSNNQMFEIVGDPGLSTFSRTTRQQGSITDYCGNSGITDYSSVSQGDSSIYSLIVSGSSEVTKWRMNETQISGSTTNGVDTSIFSITPDDITLDTLAVIVKNLPTSSSGLTSNQLFTQTATQLGGTGTTKVICVV